MKKIFLTFVATCIALILTGCKNTTPMEDYLNTNKGTSSYNQIMKTENGYYYNASWLGKMSLRYHDNATGNDIYLCAKPECAHDGDEFCTATSPYSVAYTGMYNDNIYIAALGSNNIGMAYKLLKASLDGTELTEVCTFIQLSGERSSIGLYYEDTRTMILHRGYAFIPYSLKYDYAKDDDISGLAIINLSDGSIQTMPEYEKSGKTAYQNITPYGDCIYYTLSKTELHRYNFTTGEDEILPLKENLTETYGNNFSKKLKELNTYTIIDDKIWYLCGGTKKSESSMFIYDPAENTTTLIEGFGDELQAETTTYDTFGEPTGTSTNYCVSPQPMYDGKYLYIIGQGFFASEYDYYDMQVHIFTLEGERLGGFVFQRKGSCQINILDETFYIQTPEGTVCCSVSNVISGNIEWTKLYQFENGEY